MKNIRKVFPGITALDNVDFSLCGGEIHALLGENGAGKSTLMKILAGMYYATSGSIEMNGGPASIDCPRDALKHGIGMVYQHFTLAPELTVLENILLGTVVPFYMNTRELEKRVRGVTDVYGLRLDLRAKVWQLSVGEQQRVEIAKCFYHGAAVLILDEPTAVLTPPETKELFAMMRQVAKNGYSIVFISHKLNEVLSIADRVTVFRKGRKVGIVPAAEATEQSLSRMMIGRDIQLEEAGHEPPAGAARLILKGVSANNDKGLPAVDNVSLEIREAEIVGIAAVSGNGQAELAEAIAGLRPVTGGSIELDTGEKLHEMTIRQIIEAGVSNISEKRLDRSLIPGFSIAQNLIVKDYRAKEYRKNGMLDQAAIRDHAAGLIEAYDIAAPGADTPARVLSGGNAQKVVLARELSREHKVILAVNPTYGLDVGAVEFVQERLRAERDKGTAVLLISEELDELIRLADRVAVMSRGKVVAVLAKKDFNREKIGLLMTGGEPGD
jgi:simple sugar transport system ATP-binding protein